MLVLISNLSVGKARLVTQRGRSWYVAPATTIVPGVLPGSQGPLYYPLAQIARNHSEWDGMPVTVYHPADELGNPVGAAYPGVRNRQQIGVVRHTTCNGKLRHEVWVSVDRARAVDPTTSDGGSKVLNALANGTPMELSTGLYTENVPAENGAHHNGRGYTHIATNYRPDHLALLPDQKGACSIQDGCGLLVNYSPDQGRDEKGQFASAAYEASKSAQEATADADKQTGYPTSTAAQAALEATESAEPQSVDTGKGTLLRGDSESTIQHHLKAAIAHDVSANRIRMFLVRAAAGKVHEEGTRPAHEGKFAKLAGAVKAHEYAKQTHLNAAGVHQEVIHSENPLHERHPDQAMNRGDKSHPPLGNTAGDDKQGCGNGG